MTNEHKKYLKNIKNKKRIITIGRLSVLFFFILLWQVLVYTKLLDSFIFSSPVKIFNTIVTLLKDKMLFTHIFTTLYEVIISFIISILLSILLASLLWYFPTIAKILDPYLTIINSLPKVALGPIILIWFGTNTKSIIIMGILISTIVLTMNIYDGFISVDKNKIKLIKSITSSKIDLYKYLILPSNTNTIISNLKICISMSLIGIIMGEFLVSKKGIGYLILYGSQVFNLNLVMTGIIILCIMATSLYYVIYYIEKKYKNKS